MMDLRLGKWQDVLADVGQVDAIITDPPYSQRTVDGYCDADGGHGVGYDHLSDENEFVKHWGKRARWWMVIHCDHYQFAKYEQSVDSTSWYTFAPVYWVKKDGMPRLLADGPACQVEPIFVARRRLKLPSKRRGSRPGFYIANVDKRPLRTGGKPLALMRAIIRDYTRPGDLICDPFAGGGTTLLAAAIEGRRAIGAECDPKTYAKAKKRLEGGYTPDMFGG